MIEINFNENFIKKLEDDVTSHLYKILTGEVKSDRKYWYIESNIYFENQYCGDGMRSQRENLIKMYLEKLLFMIGIYHYQMYANEMNRVKLSEKTEIPTVKVRENKNERLIIQV